MLLTNWETRLVDCCQQRTQHADLFLNHRSAGTKRKETLRFNCLSSSVSFRPERLRRSDAPAAARIRVSSPSERRAAMTRSARRRESASCWSRPSLAVAAADDLAAGSPCRRPPRAPSGASAPGRRSASLAVSLESARRILARRGSACLRAPPRAASKLFASESVSAAIVEPRHARDRARPVSCLGDPRVRSRARCEEHAVLDAERHGVGRFEEGSRPHDDELRFEALVGLQVASTSSRRSFDGARGAAGSAATGSRRPVTKNFPSRRPAAETTIPGCAASLAR